MAEHGHVGGVERQQAEQVEDVGRIGLREILDPAVERRLAHFDGDEQDLVEREEDRDLDQHRQTAGDRIDLLALEQLHLLLLLLHLVVGVFGLQFLELRLQRLHLRHRQIRLVGEREEGELDDDGDGQDREAEIADQLVEEVDQLKHRASDEVEPAPVDQKVELGDARVLLIAVEQLRDLGAGEDIGLGFARLAGLDRLRFAERIGLIGFLDGAAARQSPVEGLGLVGRDGRGPIFVGEADPAAHALEGLLAAGLLLDLVVGVFLNAAVADDADQAFVQHRIAGGFGLAVTRDQRERIERDRLFGLVLDRVLHSEEIIVVDRDLALEDEPLAVVEAERHRRGRRQLRAISLPERFRIGQVELLAGGRDIADLGVEGMRGARGRQKLDRRALGVDRLVIFLQPEIVDASALEGDRAGQAGGVDGQAGAGRQRLVARFRGGGNGRARRGRSARLRSA